MTENMTNRVKGKAEEIGGTIQKNLGHLFGNEEMEAKGMAHEVKGEARQMAAKAAEQVGGTIDKVVGSVKATVGDAVGNKSLKAKGEAQELKGKARKALNK